MCRPMRTYTKRPWCFQKSSGSFWKSSGSFLKTSAPFHVEADGITPPQSGHSFFSLHPYILIKTHWLSNGWRWQYIPSSSFQPCFPSPFTICLQSTQCKLCTPTLLFSLPFFVGAAPYVCPGTVHFKLSELSGGHMGPPLQSMKALSKKFKSNSRFLRMKGGWKSGDGMSLHGRKPINRTFQRLMKGERKKRFGWYGSFIIKRFQPFLNKL